MPEGEWHLRLGYDFHMQPPPQHALKNAYIVSIFMQKDAINSAFIVSKKHLTYTGRKLHVMYSLQVNSSNPGSEIY